MKQSQSRFLGLASLLLVTGSVFVACGSLDGRKITRDREYSAGGDSSDGGRQSSSGGSESQAGGPPVNPFGGAFDNGGAPTIVDGPPTVTKVDPEDMATDVDLEANVSFLFSEAVDPATLTTDSIKLLDGTLEVQGDVSATTDQVAAFEPTRRLSLATTYTTSVTTDVTDTTGQKLASAFTSTFTTRDGVWTEGLPFVDDPAMNWNYYTSSAQMAVDGRGNVLVVWQQYDGLHARWYRQTTGWQEPVVLSAMGVYVNEGHSVAVSPDGDAFVVWSQSIDMPAGYQVMARRFVGGAWSEAPEVVSGANPVPSNPSSLLVALRGGHALVRWNYYEYNTQYYYYIAAQSATLEGAWKDYPDSLAYANGATEFFSSYQPLTMDSAGNAMLVYSRVNSTNNLGQLNYVKFIAATGVWENSAQIAGATDVYYSSTFSASLDDTGEAAVVWAKNTGATYDLMASHYTKAKGFSMPLPLDELDTEPYMDWRNGVVNDGTGFVLAWRQAVGATYNAYGSHYSNADDTWSPGTLISDGNTGLNGIPTVVADRHGNAMVLWPQKSGSGTSYADTEFRFARWLGATSTWSGPDVVLGDLNFDYYRFQAAAADNGFVALLSQDTGNYSDRPGQPFLSVFH